jgi:choloylglycine hydrolase
VCGLAEASLACTSVCLTTPARVVFGNNLDWFVDDGLLVINKRGVRKQGLWFEEPPEWTSRYASLTVNQEGREFPSRGMNEVGPVVGEMTLRAGAYPSETPDTP